MTTQTLRPASAIPCLPRTLLVGNALDLQRDRLGLLRRVLRELGEVGAFHLGGRPIYVFTSPRYASEILVERALSFEKGPMLRKFARPFVGDGLFAGLNAGHARRRGAAAPAFARPRISGHVEAMAGIASAACAGWTSGTVLRLYDELRRVSMRVIARTLFSVDLTPAHPERDRPAGSIESKDAGAIARGLDVGMAYISDRLRHPFHLPLWLPTPGNLRVRRAAARLDEFISELVRTRRAGSSEGADVLAGYLREEGRDEGAARLTDRELVDDLKALFFAGFETTASALAFGVSLLVRNPISAERLRAEVDSVLGDRLPGADDLARMPFGQRVVKEVLRLYPPAHSIGRVAATRVTIGDYDLPPGAVVLVSPYLLHRREECFPDPERFLPDRFTDEASSRLPKLAYLPFGAGARSCLGNHYALAEIHVVLSILARRFTFEHVGAPGEPEVLLTLRPRNGLPMRVTRREHAPGGRP